MAQPYIGEIRMFGGNFAIRGWAKCEGQLLAIASHSALFSILGTTYGGDGRTTFGLPDFRGRVPLAPGNGAGLPNYQLGERGGNPTTTLLANNLPSHNHTAGTLKVGVSPAGADSDEATNNFLASTGEDLYAPVTQGITLTTMGTGSVQGDTGSTGASIPFSNQSPYLAITFLIALVGIFPSRS